MGRTFDTALNTFIGTGGIQSVGNAIQRNKQKKQQQELVNALKKDVFFSSMFGEQFIPQQQNQALGALSNQPGQQNQASGLPELMKNKQARDSLYLGNIFQYATNPAFGDAGKQFAEFALSKSDTFLGESAKAINQVDGVINSVLNTQVTQGEQAAVQQLSQSLNQVSPQARATIQGFLKSGDPLGSIKNARAVLGGAEELRKASLQNQSTQFKTDQAIKLENTRTAGDIAVERERRVTKRTPQQINVNNQQELTKTTKNDVQKDILFLEEQIRKLDSIENVFDPEVLTTTSKGMAAVGSFLDKLGIESSFGGTREALEQQARVKPKIKEFFNAYRKEITGAAAAVAELADLEQATLNFNISPREFEIRFEEIQGAAKRELIAKRDAAREGIDVSPDSSTQKSTTPKPESDTKKIDENDPLGIR